MREPQSMFHRAALLLSLVPAVLALSAMPASAHTLDEAVRAPAGCAWLDGDYATLHSSPVTTESGTSYGTAHLLWSSTYQQNCVITLKSSYHGTPTWTTSTIWVQDGLRYREQGDFAHFTHASVAAAGRCVAYEGSISSTPGETGGTTATGGRLEWGNCG